MRNRANLYLDNLCAYTIYSLLVRLQWRSKEMQWFHCWLLHLLQQRCLCVSLPCGHWCSRFRFQLCDTYVNSSFYHLSLLVLLCFFSWRMPWTRESSKWNCWCWQAPVSGCGHLLLWWWIWAGWWGGSPVPDWWYMGGRASILRGDTDRRTYYRIYYWTYWGTWGTICRGSRYAL